MRDFRFLGSYPYTQDNDKGKLTKIGTASESIAICNKHKGISIGIMLGGEFTA